MDAHQNGLGDQDRWRSWARRSRCASECPTGFWRSERMLNPTPTNPEIHFEPFTADEGDQPALSLHALFEAEESGYCGLRMR